MKAGAVQPEAVNKRWKRDWGMTLADEVVSIDPSWAPWVSGESQGRVTWGRPGAWPYACLWSCLLAAGGYFQDVHPLAQEFE